MVQTSALPLATSQAGRPGLQGSASAKATTGESAEGSSFAGLLEAAMGERPSTGPVRARLSAPGGSRRGGGDSDLASGEDAQSDRRTEPVEATVGPLSALGALLEGVSWPLVGSAPAGSDGVTATGTPGAASAEHTAQGPVLGLLAPAEQPTAPIGSDDLRRPDGVTVTPGSLPASGESAEAARTPRQAPAGSAAGVVVGEAGHGRLRGALAGRHSGRAGGLRTGPDGATMVSAEAAWRLSMPAAMAVVTSAGRPVKARGAAGDAEPNPARTANGAAAYGSGEVVEVRVEALTVRPAEVPAAPGGQALEESGSVGHQAHLAATPALLSADAAEPSAPVTGESPTPVSTQATSEPTASEQGTDLHAATDDMQALYRATQEARADDDTSRSGDTALQPTDIGVGAVRSEPVSPSAVVLGSTTDAPQASTRTVGQASRLVAEHVSRWVESSAGESGARVQVVDSLLGEDGGEVRLRLHPPELGEIRLRLHADGPRLVVQATVQQHETGWMLRQNSHLLERALEQAGLQLAGFSVEVGRHGHDPQPGPSPWGGAWPELLEASGVAAVGEAHLGAPERPLWVRLGLGAVDVRV